MKHHWMQSITEYSLKLASIPLNQMYFSELSVLNYFRVFLIKIKRRLFYIRIFGILNYIKTSFRGFIFFKRIYKNFNFPKRKPPYPIATQRRPTTKNNSRRDAKKKEIKKMQKTKKYLPKKKNRKIIRILNSTS